MKKTDLEVEKCMDKFEKIISGLDETIERIRRIGGVMNEYESLRELRAMKKNKIWSLKQTILEAEEGKEDLEEELELEKEKLMDIKDRIKELETRIKDFDNLEAFLFYLGEKKPKLMNELNRVQTKLTKFRAEVRRW